MTDLEQTDFIVSIINNYIKHYKIQNQKPNNMTMFDDIDENNETSTNKIMEEFYGESIKYKENGNNEIIKFNELNEEITSFDELYGIFENDNRNPICVSQSFFSLLIELTNLQYENETKEYTIVNLK